MVDDAVVDGAVLVVCPSIRMSVAGDDVVADDADPVVVDVCRPRHDCAVILCVFLDEAGLGVDEGLEVEGVCARAACHDVVGMKGLVGIELAVGEFSQRIALVAVRVVGDLALAPVGL